MFEYLFSWFLLRRRFYTFNRLIICYIWWVFICFIRQCLFSVWVRNFLNWTTLFDTIFRLLSWFSLLSCFSLACLIAYLARFSKNSIRSFWLYWIMFETMHFGFLILLNEFFSINLSRNNILLFILLKVRRLITIVLLLLLYFVFILWIINLYRLFFLFYLR